MNRDDAVTRFVGQFAQPFGVDAKDLEHPISLKRDGSIATLADLIASSKDEIIKAEFRAAFGKAIPESAADIIPAAELDHASMRYVASGVLCRMNPYGTVAILGGMRLTPAEAISHIERATPQGFSILADFVTNSSINEKAVEMGKVKPKIAPTNG